VVEEMILLANTAMALRTTLSNPNHNPPAPGQVREATHVRAAAPPHHAAAAPVRAAAARGRRRARRHRHLLVKGEFVVFKAL